MPHHSTGATTTGVLVTASRGALADGLAQDGVDADRQVRPVLLDRGDGQDHDRVGLGLGAQVLGGQLLPQDGLGHQ